MSTLVHTVAWVALIGAAIGIAWVYGTSWRALARALAEAEGRDGCRPRPVIR